MDINMLVAVIVALTTATFALPVPDGQSNVVPGVFISADTLKGLQQQAEQNHLNGPLQVNQPGSTQRYSESNLAGNQNGQDISLKLNPPYQSNSLPQEVKQPSLATSQPVAVIQQPIATNQQPILTNQQPQAMLSNQQPILLTQQPGQQNPQTIFVSQQPNLSNQGAILFSPQPNQAIVLQNGQIAQYNPATGQPILFTNGNQQVQNPNNVYAVIPMNGQSNVPNTNANLGNSNTYLVPVQPASNANPIYTVSYANQ